MGFAIAFQTACVNTSLTQISLQCAECLAFSYELAGIIFIHLKLAVNKNIQLAQIKAIKNSHPSLIAKFCDIRQYSIKK